jgi:Sporulation and spore germination
MYKRSRHPRSPSARIDTRRKLAPLTVALLLLTLTPRLDAQSERRPRLVTRPANVYLWSVADEAQPKTLGLVPARRSVNRFSPGRGALEALIAGPTDEERSRGLRAPHSEAISIKALVIANGTAEVSFVSDCPTCQRWPDSTAPRRFRRAVELTLKQFPSVRRVRICFDGYEDFDRLSKKRCR